MAKYVYRIERSVYIDVEIEASSEDEAQEEYERMEFEGVFNDRLKNKVLESEPYVFEVWEGDIDDGICVYSVW